MTIHEPHWKPEYVCACCGTWPGNRTLRFVVTKPIYPNATWSVTDLFTYGPDVYEIGHFCPGCWEYLFNHIDPQRFLSMGAAWGLKKIE